MPSTAWTVEKNNNTTGLAPTLQNVDSANGNKFLNRSGGVRLLFHGATSATGQATVVRQRPNSVGTLVNATTAASALDAATKFVGLGPFDDSWNDGDGYVHVTYSGTVTNVKATVTDDANP